LVLLGLHIPARPTIALLTARPYRAYHEKVEYVHEVTRKVNKSNFGAGRKCNNVLPNQDQIIKVSDVDRLRCGDAENARHENAGKGRTKDNCEVCLVEPRNPQIALVPVVLSAERTSLSC